MYITLHFLNEIVSCHLSDQSQTSESLLCKATQSESVSRTAKKFQIVSIQFTVALAIIEDICDVVDK